MRIAQTSDGRYIKVMSPQFEGMAGRIYGEIRDRREVNDRHDATLNQHNNQIGIISSQMETMLIRYAEMTELLRRLFPEDEPIAVIEKPLEVSGGVKALNFVSTNAIGAPLTVASQTMVTNLNVEFLGGKNLAGVLTTAATDATTKVTTLSNSVTEQFTAARQVSNLAYAPIGHVGSSGVGVHAVATQTEAGFISTDDKKKLDGFVLPGGIQIGISQPSSPKTYQVWIDVSPTP